MHIIPIHFQKFNSYPNFKGITITETTTQQEGNYNITIKHNTYYPFADEPQREIKRNFTRGITRYEDVFWDFFNYLEVHNKIGKRLPISKFDYATVKAVTDLNDSEILDILN